MRDKVEKGEAFLAASKLKRAKLHRAIEFWGPLEELWEQGLPKGSLTGWPSLDEHYTVAPGQLSLVTGYPGAGKSEFIDALAVNLSHAGWRTVFFSPENRPIELHIAKLAEKLSGKPFGRGPTERMSLEELGRHTEQISERFRFLAVPHDQPITIPDVLDAVGEKLGELKGAFQALCIDPWNELEHWRPSGMSETEYVSHALSLLRGWARDRKVHVWMIAHPAKQRREDGKLPIPTPDSISGSANFWNKADNALCVYREMAAGDSPDVSIYVQKVRFRHIGRRGVVPLIYDRISGQYRDPMARPRRVQEVGA